MAAKIVKQIELFSAAEQDNLQFLPEELDAIEEELYPKLDSISFKDVAEDLDTYFQEYIQEVGLETKSKPISSTPSTKPVMLHASNAGISKLSQGGKKSSSGVKPPAAQQLPLRKSPRKPVPIRVIPQYFQKPKYGQTKVGRGTRMEVVLGPAAVDTVNGGTPTTPSTGISPFIKDLNEYEKKNLHEQKCNKWIAGHLLNRHLGGSGTEKQNLVPLTDQANKLHSGSIEQPIKFICDAARQFKNLDNSVKNWYGVHYIVEASEESYDNKYNKVPKYISCEVYIVTVEEDLLKNTTDKQFEVQWKPINLNNGKDKFIEFLQKNPAIQQFLKTLNTNKNKLTITNKLS